ncbi:MAG: hypothetical protein ACFFDH_04500 [Promethearchaeota archaeon]
MALEKNLTRFYPNLASRILLYLRSVYYKKEFVYPQELIIYFKSSKSFISQKLKILKKYHLIETKKVKNSTRSASYLKIYITKKGLITALEILSDGLNSSELKIIKNKKRK